MIVEAQRIGDTVLLTIVGRTVDGETVRIDQPLDLDTARGLAGMIGHAATCPRHHDDAIDDAIDRILSP